jgi:hypothetical protein
MATGVGWQRADLVTVIGHRLTEPDRQDLGSTASPHRLVELMAATGVLAPATMMRALWAEGVGDETAASLVPAGAVLGASTSELREAGCSAREILAAAPREELRRLDTRESTWAQAGPALLDAGFTISDAVTELAVNAPNAVAFAASVTAIVTDPVDAFALSLPKATAADLITLSERFELPPIETAHALSAACADVDTTVAVLLGRCDGDIAAVTEIAASVLSVGQITVERALGRDGVVDVEPVLADFDKYRDVDELAIVDL